MTALIRANRPEVSRQFPVLGFTIRTGVTPSWVEVAIATDPTLFFGADAKARRSPANFYSSRVSGLLPAEKGDVVYLVPPEVLGRFAGQTKIYYALAVYRQGDFRNPEVIRVPPEAMPYVQVSNSFTGTRRSLMAMPHRNGGSVGKGTGYIAGDKASLEWGGDVAVPGEMTTIPAPSPNITTPTAPTNGAIATPHPPSTPTMQGFAFAYDDGYGEFPEPPFSGYSNTSNTLQIAAGREELSNVPLLSEHRGSQPNLILRWNGMTDPTSVDVVVHLHGYSNAGDRMSISREKEPYSGFENPDNPHDLSLGRSRPTLALLPCGHFFGGTHNNGYNFPALIKPGGLQSLIDFALSHFCQSTGLSSLSADRLILTAHSGGGVPLMRILRHINPHEIHVFDALYQDPSNLIQWLQQRLRKDITPLETAPSTDAQQYMRSRGGALRVFYRSGTATEPHSLAVHRALMSLLPASGAAAILRDWYRVERTNVGHRDMPRRYGWLLLADASATLTNAAVPTTQSLAFASTAFGENNGNGNGGSGPIDELDLLIDDEAGIITPQNGFSHMTAEATASGYPAQTIYRQAKAFSSEILYDVQLIAQPDKFSCWAASMAMLVGYSRGISIAPETLAQEVGRSLRTCYSWDMLEAVKDHFGFRNLDLPSNATLCPSPEQWFRWLSDYGPLWVTVRGEPSHAIIVRGISGDLTPAGTMMYVLNPWDTRVEFSSDEIDFIPPNEGYAYEQDFATFAADFGRINLPLGNWRVLYLPPNPSVGMSRQMGVAYAAQFHSRTLGDAPYQQYENRMATGSGGHGHGQTLYAGGSRNSQSTAQSYVTALAFTPLPGEAVQQMQAEFVANAARSQTEKLNCITIANAGLRKLFGSQLQNADGSAKALGDRINRTMAALQGYGLAQSETIFEFNDSQGRLTKGVVRPETLQSSVESWLLTQAEANQMSAWYCFGLSILDGYHSVILALAFSGTRHPDTKIYWADQIYNGWNDITGGLDARLLELTQRWWDLQLAQQKPLPRTRATVWPLTLGDATTTIQSYRSGAFSSNGNGFSDSTDYSGIDVYNELDDDEGETWDEASLMTLARGLETTRCTDDHCEENYADTAGTEHFSLSEFRCNDGQDVPQRFRGHTQKLMENLEVLRAELNNRSIRISSGYRSPEYNTQLLEKSIERAKRTGNKVGVARKSQHMCGKAADIQVDGVTPSTVYATIERLIAENRMAPGGLFKYPTFVHYDVRGTNARGRE
jgi:uncharacterized protein YcbK (DUF882 family)